MNASYANLKNQVVTSFLWRLLETGGGKLVTLFVSIIIARQINPEAYGILSIIMALLYFLQAFIDSGMGVALIRKKDADELDFSTLFLFNTGGCILLYCAVFFSAPLIAAFYAIPQLTVYIRVASLSLLIFGINNIQMAYVTKNLLYKTHFIAGIVAILISSIIALVMVYLNYGIWALIAQFLSSSIVVTIATWLQISWKPKLIFSWSRLQGLVSFGWKILAAGLVDRGYSALHSGIVGKLYSPTTLAFWERGNSFPGTISGVINSSISSIFFPMQSKLQDDLQAMKKALQRSIKTGTFIMAPMMIGLSVCAEPLVRLILTEKWLPCVFFMRIVCIVSIFPPVNSANLATIQALGHSGLFLKLEIFRKSITFVLLLATMFISIEVMALSLLVTALADLTVNTYYNHKLINYGFFEQMKDISSTLLLAAFMGGCVYLLTFLPLNSLAILGLQIVSGAVIYLCLSLLARKEELFYLFNIVSNITKRV